MALLAYKAPVDYEAQLDAFHSFLEKFETTKSASDEATEAIDGLNLDEDHTSDEYDFMDDVAERRWSCSGDSKGPSENMWKCCRR